MSDDLVRRARSELERAVQETTSGVERRVEEIDERLRDLQTGVDGSDGATRDARLKAVVEDLSILKERTDGQTYTKLKRAEALLGEHRNAE